MKGLKPHSRISRLSNGWPESLGTRSPKNKHGVLLRSHNSTDPSRWAGHRMLRHPHQEVEARALVSHPLSKAIQPGSQGTDWRWSQARTPWCNHQPSTTSSIFLCGTWHWLHPVKNLFLPALSQLTPFRYRFPFIHPFTIAINPWWAEGAVLTHRRSSVTFNSNNDLYQW